MDGIAIQLALIGALVLLNAIFAGSEIALISLRDNQVARLAGRGRAGAALAALARDPNRFLATIQIGITLAGFLASATAAVTLADPLVAVLEPLGEAARPVAIMLVTLLLTFVTLVLGELAPKRIALQRPEPWGLLVARPLAALSTASRPAVWLLGRATDVVVRLAGADPRRQREEITEEELRDMVAAQPTMSREERMILAGAFEFSDRPVRQIVTPRMDVDALPADLPVAEAAERLVRQGHSRAPVLGRDLDDVLGVVHLRALIGTTGTVGERCQPPVIVPETASAFDVLRRLQEERQQLAVVIDEHGGTEGIVTIEDLVEELVGEIWDESDPDVVGAQIHADGSVTVPGSYPLHDLIDVGITLPHSEAVTVAGAVIEALGRLPRSGAVARLGAWDAQVLRATDRVIQAVRLRPRHAPGR